MTNYDKDFDFTETDSPTSSTYGMYDAVTDFETDRFQDEYKTFEFEVMTEVPTALAAFVSHQQTFDL